MNILFQDEFSGILSYIHVIVYEKYRLFFFDFTETSIFSTDFQKMLKCSIIKFSENPLNGSH